MRNLILTLAAACLCSAFAASPAAARDYPFCLVSPENPPPGDCSYNTYAQCLASASGRLASCYDNPWMAYAEPRGAHHHRRRHHHQY